MNICHRFLPGFLGYLSRSLEETTDWGAWKTSAFQVWLFPAGCSTRENCVAQDCAVTCFSGLDDVDHLLGGFSCDGHAGGRLFADCKSSRGNERPRYSTVANQLPKDILFFECCFLKSLLQPLTSRSSIFPFPVANVASRQRRGYRFCDGVPVINSINCVFRPGWAKRGLVLFFRCPRRRRKRKRPDLRSIWSLWQDMRQASAAMRASSCITTVVMLQAMGHVSCGLLRTSYSGWRGPARRVPCAAFVRYRCSAWRSLPILPRVASFQIPLSDVSFSKGGSDLLRSHSREDKISIDIGFGRSTPWTICHTATVLS